MDEKISLLIVDDYPVVINGLISMLKDHEEIILVGSANNGKSAVEMALDVHPKVILMNIDMPEMDGLEATHIIKENIPDSNILIFSGIKDFETVFPAIKAGAIGYILKNATEKELVEAIHQVANGEPWMHPSLLGQVFQQINEPKDDKDFIHKLSNRELDVLKYMTQGFSNQEIAKLMVVSPTTVHSHVSHILSKLEVASRTQAVIYAMRAGILPES